jgi:glycosidase
MHFFNLSDNVSDNKLLIYQLLVRLFGNKNTENAWYGTLAENGAGKFADIDEKALNYIRETGFSHVWFTGVLEHATLTDYSEYGIPPDHPHVVKGRAGSPYAIKDYYDVAPDLAVNVPNRMAEFEALLQRTHAAGLKAIIDFVPNHVARSYQSDAKPNGISDLGENDDTSIAFSPQNNFYYFPDQPFLVPQGHVPPPNVEITKPYTENPAKATGNDCFSPQPHLDDWFETVKLNYGINVLDYRHSHFEPIPNTWLKMRDIVLFWASKGVDGFRCDMAEMVPVAFWGWLITQVKTQYPQVIFIAEVYNPQFYFDYVEYGKFDYLYDKVGLYDLVRVLTYGYGDANDITNCWHKLAHYNNKMLRFMENHDEHRIAAPQFVGDAFKAVPGMILSATIASGPLMVYNGQEVGEPATGDCGFSGDDGRTTIFDYFSMPEWNKLMNSGKFDGGLLSARQHQLFNFYKKLVNVCKQSSAIREGHTFDLQEANKCRSFDYNDTRVYSFLRFTGKQKLLIVVSFEQRVLANAVVKIPVEAWRAMGTDLTRTLLLQDLLGNHPPVECTAWSTIHLEDVRAGIPVRIEPLQGYIFEITTR